jgi:hypothetical protein
LDPKCKIYEKDIKEARKQKRKREKKEKTK